MTIEQPVRDAPAPAGAGEADQHAAAAAKRVFCLRAGAFEQQGLRSSMEDASIVLSDLKQHLPQALQHHVPDVAALYAVFDGHHGAAAAAFAKERLLSSLLGTPSFPTDLQQSLAHAFLDIDHHYYLATRQAADSAGTTALAALLWGRTLVVANAGDSRAVLSRRGKALQLSRDHKADEPDEQRRICEAGGYVCDGRLCGELTVSRALGNHHRDIKAVPAAPPPPRPRAPPSDQQPAPAPPQGHACPQPQPQPQPLHWAMGPQPLQQPSVPPVGPTDGPPPPPEAAASPPCAAAAAPSGGPLIADPELTVTQLQPDDEFLLMACDGIWDVFSSQRAVEFARLRLGAHNDPQRAAAELVTEALRMHSGDNVTVILVALQEGPPPRRTFGGGGGRAAPRLQAQGLMQLARLLELEAQAQ